MTALPLAASAFLLLSLAGEAIAAATPQEALDGFLAVHGDYVRSGGGIPSADMRARLRPLLAPAVTRLLDDAAAQAPDPARSTTGSVERRPSEDFFLEAKAGDRIIPSGCTEADARTACDVGLAGPEGTRTQRLFLVRLDGRWVVEDIDEHDAQARLVGCLRSRLRSIGD